MEKTNSRKSIGLINLLKAFLRFFRKQPKQSPSDVSKSPTLKPKSPVENSDSTKNEPTTVEEDKGELHIPIRADKFHVVQKFLNPDPKKYPKTGHHTGVDYGTQGEDNVPLYFCADGEVIEAGFNKEWFGNYFLFYAPDFDRTFVYFHLRDSAPRKGSYKAGEQCGIAGNTGFSRGIHLHLECMKGRKTLRDRSILYTSKDALMNVAECADSFIRPSFLGGKCCAVASHNIA